MPTSACPQKPRQAQHRQALDQGTDPGQSGLRHLPSYGCFGNKGATEPLELS